MRGIGRTFANLARLREQWEAVTGSEATALGDARPAAGRVALSRVDGFGSNPGGLEMYTYVPERPAAAPALVVVLHGCTQSAAGYNHGSAWSELADRYGFVLLFPQQVAANNPKTCFNWFAPADIARDGGEALSIRQMVARAVADHGIDERRIFVTGLSAGGAMAAVMLATYPEVFAGGAIIAGLPYGGARNVQEALESMFTGRSLPAPEWGDRVRAASPHRGPWPTLSIWYGGADHVVKPSNADELVRQWTNVHGLPLAPSARDSVDGRPREIWRDRDGRAVIESITIPGLGHGTPLATAEEFGGSAGPFMLEAGISSSHHIARFWGLADPAITRPATDVAIVSPDGVVRLPRRTPAPKRAKPTPDHGTRTGPTEALDVGGIIRRALESAGLTKR